MPEKLADAVHRLQATLYGMTNRGNAMPPPDSLFRRMASLVTVRDLQTPIGVLIDSKEEIIEARKRVLLDADKKGYEPNNRVHLVWSAGWVLGWLPFESLERDGIAKDSMELIPPAHILSAHCTFHEAIISFDVAAFPFFFVLDGIEGIRGTLHYRDLFSSAGRLCLFAVALDLEHAAMELCSHRKNAQQCWNVLPPVSQSLARRHFMTRSKLTGRAVTTLGHLEIQHLIRCTSFKDKCRMIKECELVPDMSETELEGIFRQAELIRNACAHPTQPEEFELFLERDELYWFDISVKALADKIRLNTPKD